MSKAHEMPYTIPHRSNRRGVMKPHQSEAMTRLQQGYAVKRTIAAASQPWALISRSDLAHQYYERITVVPSGQAQYSSPKASQRRIRQLENG